jgi:proline-specific peptidase
MEEIAVHENLTPGFHQVELDGITQAYEVVGEGPACLVHSGGPGIDSGYLRMSPLESRMTMVYLDPVGSGKSGLLPGGDYSVVEYARRLELLREHLGLTRPFLMGHSHGGFVALQHALDYPSRVRGLMVYASAPTYSSDLLDEAARQLAAFAERWPDRPEAVAAVRLYQHNREDNLVTDRNSFLEYMTTLLPAYYADFRKTTKALGTQPTLTISAYDPARRRYEWDVRGRLGTIDVPTLVLAGTYDFICPPVWSREIHAEIPDSELIEFTDSGHFPHVEEPEKFFGSVHRFVAEVARSRRGR